MRSDGGRVEHRTSMDNLFYTYVLISKLDGKFYIGYSGNLSQRLREHREGNVPATAHRLPLELVYFEACRNVKDALHREKYFKMGYGRKFLKERLKQYFHSQ